jgi:hypothetical protein
MRFDCGRDRPYHWIDVVLRWDVHPLGETRKIDLGSQEDPIRGTCLAAGRGDEHDFPTYREALEQA